MPETRLKEIADNANMIVAGYAFTLTKDGFIRILNLENIDEACVLDRDGNMLETTMTDGVLCMVQGYYLRNKEFLEA